MNAPWLLDNLTTFLPDSHSFNISLAGWSEQCRPFCNISSLRGSLRSVKESWEASHSQLLLSAKICSARLTSSFDRTSSLCPSALPPIRSLTSTTSYSTWKRLPLLFVLFINPPTSILPSLPPINSSDNVSHRCSHYSARGASLLHLPVMDFQCFEHLTSHVVVSLPWVASLCKLFRNAWTLSVLLYSFRHYPIPRQSGIVRPPLSSPAALSHSDSDCRFCVAAAHHEIDWTQKIQETESLCGEK